MAPIQPPSIASAHRIRWDCLLDGLGTDQFDAALASVLAETCGALWYSALVLSNGALRELARSWIRRRSTDSESVGCDTWPVCVKPADYLASCTSNVALCVAPLQCAPGMAAGCVYAYQQVVLVCALRAKVPYGLVLAVPRTEGLALDQADATPEWADIVITALAKHAVMMERSSAIGDALVSADEIESCLRATSDLSKREAEVCARVLYGLSSVGIALDLSVSECTVKTYRRRAYQRLAVGSERELLNWYLSRWSAWRQARGFNLKRSEAGDRRLSTSEI